MADKKHEHAQEDHCQECGWCNVWFNCGCIDPRDPKYAKAGQPLP